MARFRRPCASGNYQEFTIGKTDDYVDADGTKVLSFDQAKVAACEWFADMEQNGGRKAVPYRVSNALDDYIAGFTGKDVANTQRRIEAIIRPQIGNYDIAKLTSKMIADWHLAIAQAPARLRTSKGAVQNFRPTADTFEARRSRRSSANRILTILKAALNVASRNEKVADDHARRRVVCGRGKTLPLSSEGTTALNPDHFLPIGLA